LELLDRARAIAADHDSGAAELLARLLPLLGDAIHAGGGIALDVSRIVLGGQPGMAPLWHACAAAHEEASRPGAFARARLEFERAPQALARAATNTLRDLLLDDSNVLLLTLSYSSSVRDPLATLVVEQRLRVVCGEGRPRLEGRRLAEALQSAGAEVTLVVDAAVTSFLDEASAVVLGADAVAADYWINKVGSFGLAAAAWHRGVPVYVVAGRHKLAPAVLAKRLLLDDGPSAELGVMGAFTVRNPYFERIPIDLATLVLTEAGRLAPAEVELAGNRGTAVLAKLIADMSVVSS
jgi:translation initiation factor 2B subunit (eIF-2B alpha/beta/delta family)